VEHVHRPAPVGATAERSVVEDGVPRSNVISALRVLAGIQDVGHGWPPFTAVILRTSTTTHDWLARRCESALVIP
jgi:hypothetical protein